MKNTVDEKRVRISKKNPCIERNAKKCKKCGMCKIVCNRDVAVDGYYDEEDGEEPTCTGCGRCVLACPFGALKAKSQVKQAVDALQNKDKCVVFLIAPAVRVAFGKKIGIDEGKNQEGKIVAILKELGADFVFDVGFGADMTIVEEASEFVQRLLYGNKKLPQFTSCCPAWVNYVQIFMPQYLSNLSSSRSPIAMQGTAVKTYFAKKRIIEPEKIFTVAVVPCTAKKAEFLRPQNNKSGEFWGKPNMRDIDAVLTTEELTELASTQDFNFKKIKPQKFDAVLGCKTGAGLGFGRAGGVLEAVLQTAYFILNDKNPPKNLLKLENVSQGVREAIVDLGKKKIRVATICGTAKMREYAIANANNMPFFVEVMACENGCVGGAGNPKVLVGNPGLLEREKRAKALEKASKKIAIKYAHENPEIKAMYKEFFDAPLSDLSEKLLHEEHK